VNVHWYFTSFAAPVGSGGKWWNPYPQNHQTIAQGSKAQSEPLIVEAKLEPKQTNAHPFELFFPIPIGKPLRAEILRTTYADPETTTRFFVGEVRKVGDNTIRYHATLQTIMGRLSTKLPRMMISATCPHQLYDPKTCKVSRVTLTSTVTMRSFSADLPPTVSCEFASALNLVRQQTRDWFKGGIVETGIGLNYELRSIVASRWDEPTSRLILTLNHRLIKAEVDGRASVSAGCDHTLDTCENKFNNAINHISFENAPDQNLSLRALDTRVSLGGKK
jgi:uncharacterized phage protein (TIGR02218 family)